MTVATPAPPAPTATTAPPPAPPVRARRWPHTLAGCLLPILLFASLLFLYTRHNTHPLHYHPDEGGKVEQVLTGYRNWNHPAMMLDATSLLMGRLGTPQEDQPTVEVGRLVSAIFAAGCATALSLVGLFEGGLLGFLIVGLLIGLCPFLLTHAHYMKEDAGLVFGLAVMLLGSRLVFEPFRARWRELLSVLLLGAGCALTFSGKYVGGFAIPVGFLMLFPTRRWYWTDLFLRPVLFLLAVAGTFWALNPRAVDEWHDAWATFTSVIDQPTRSNWGSVLSPPGTYWLWVLRQTVPLPVAILAAAAPLPLLLTWRRRNGWDALVLLIAVLSFAMLCCAKTGFPRYALPTVILIHLIAGLSAIWSLQWTSVPSAVRASPSPRTYAVGTFILLALLVQGWRCADAVHQFSDDSRDRLRAWLEHDLQPGESAAAENYAGFSHGLRGNNSSVGKGSVDGAAFLPMLGDVETLRSQGYKYAIVCDIAHARFTDGMHVGDSEGGRFDEYNAVYSKLFKDCPIAWEAVPTHNLLAYTNPEIKVYRLKPQ